MNARTRPHMSSTDVLGLASMRACTHVRTHVCMSAREVVANARRHTHARTCTQARVDRFMQAHVQARKHAPQRTHMHICGTGARAYVHSCTSLSIMYAPTSRHACFSALVSADPVYTIKIVSLVSLRIARLSFSQNVSMAGRDMGRNTHPCWSARRA